MFCEQPKLADFRGFRDVKFPCGKCRACRSRLSNEKFIIGSFAMAEYLTKGQFITLTYSDDYLPCGLQHSDFASFMKRLRNIDGTPGVKIFVAGEYGEKTGREHFHFLVYNHRYKIYDILCAWRKGFVYDGTLTDKSLKYVTGYVSKRGYDPNTGKRPPYGRMSCNIPDGLADWEAREICQNGFVTYNGKKYSVPRNWRNRYKDYWQTFRIDRQDKQKEWFEDMKDLSPEYVKGLMDERELKYKACKYRTKKDRRI